MICAQCYRNVGKNWIEWQECHALPLGTPEPYHLATTNAAVLCVPPRACASEYATRRNIEAMKAASVRPKAV